MRILIALTYYRPHVSGLTIYAERLARGLAQRGHAVTVLTSRFSPKLPIQEFVAARLQVVRVPVNLKVSKGVIMPCFPFYAARFINRADVVNIHLPQFEAALLAGIGRARRCCVVLTYQCDLRLPPGLFNRAVEAGLVPLNELAACLAHHIVVMTSDYASHSPFLNRHRAKHAIIPPLIDIPLPDSAAQKQLAERWQLEGTPLIGLAARFAAEKGVEYLLQALPRVIREFPDVRIAFTGNYKYTIGEDAYLRRIEPLLAEHQDRLVFLDLLRTEDMPNFFSLCDVVAVTSVNSTESFGLVQVEAMLSGTPVVASDLPGVREAVRHSGMGLVVPPRDPKALADALIQVLRNPSAFQRPRAEIAGIYSLDAALERYEQLFTRCAELGGQPGVAAEDRF
jgi:glycosyltransferase involved in cell wall biosynthesis